MSDSNTPEQAAKNARALSQANFELGKQAGRIKTLLKENAALRAENARLRARLEHYPLIEIDKAAA